MAVKWMRNEAWKRVTSLLLAAIILFGSVPAYVFAVAGSSTEVLGFSELDETVRRQTVPLGVSQGDLDLPDSLRATLQRGDEIKAGEVPVLGWSSAPAYTGEEPGTYVFTPQFDERSWEFPLGFSQDLPEIRVEVENIRKGVLEYILRVELDDPAPQTAEELLEEASPYAEELLESLLESDVEEAEKTEHYIEMDEGNTPPFVVPESRERSGAADVELIEEILRQEVAEDYIRSQILEPAVQAYRLRDAQYGVEDEVRLAIEYTVDMDTRIMELGGVLFGVGWEIDDDWNTSNDVVVVQVDSGNMTDRNTYSANQMGPAVTKANEWMASGSDTVIFVNNPAALENWGNSILDTNGQTSQIIGSGSAALSNPTTINLRGDVAVRNFQFTLKVVDIVGGGSDSLTLDDCTNIWRVREFGSGTVTIENGVSIQRQLAVEKLVLEHGSTLTMDMDDDTIGENDFGRIDALVTANQVISHGTEEKPAELNMKRARQINPSETVPAPFIHFTGANPAASGVVLLDDTGSTNRHNVDSESFVLTAAGQNLKVKGAESTFILLDSAYALTWKEGVPASSNRAYYTLVDAEVAIGYDGIDRNMPVVTFEEAVERINGGEFDSENGLTIYLLKDLTAKDNQFPEKECTITSAEDGPYSFTPTSDNIELYATTYLRNLILGDNVAHLFYEADNIKVFVQDNMDLSGLNVNDYGGKDGSALLIDGSQIALGSAWVKDVTVTGQTTDAVVNGEISVGILTLEPYAELEIDAAGNISGHPISDYPEINLGEEANLVVNGGLNWVGTATKPRALNMDKNSILHVDAAVIVNRLTSTEGTLVYNGDLSRDDYPLDLTNYRTQAGETPSEYDIGSLTIELTRTISDNELNNADLPLIVLNPNAKIKDDEEKIHVIGPNNSYYVHEYKEDWGLYNSAYILKGANVNILWADSDKPVSRGSFDDAVEYLEREYGSHTHSDLPVIEILKSNDTFTALPAKPAVICAVNSALTLSPKTAGDFYLQSDTAFENITLDPGGDIYAYDSGNVGYELQLNAGVTLAFPDTSLRGNSGSKLDITSAVNWELDEISGFGEIYLVGGSTFRLNYFTGYGYLKVPGAVDLVFQTRDSDAKGIGYYMTYPSGNNVDGTIQIDEAFSDPGEDLEGLKMVHNVSGGPLTMNSGFPIQLAANTLGKDYDLVQDSANLSDLVLLAKVDSVRIDLEYKEFDGQPGVPLDRENNETYTMVYSEPPIVSFALLTANGREIVGRTGDVELEVFTNNNNTPVEIHTVSLTGTQQLSGKLGYNQGNPHVLKAAYTAAGNTVDGEARVKVTQRQLNVDLDFDDVGDYVGEKVYDGSAEITSSEILNAWETYWQSPDRVTTSGSNNRSEAVVDGVKVGYGFLPGESAIGFTIEEPKLSYASTDTDLYEDWDVEPDSSGSETAKNVRIVDLPLAADTDSNYTILLDSTAADFPSQTAIITRRPVTIGGSLPSFTKVYDGDTGVIGDDPVELPLTGIVPVDGSVTAEVGISQLEYDSADAGNRTIAFKAGAGLTDLTLRGGKRSNYALDPDIDVSALSFSGTIAKRHIYLGDDYTGGAVIAEKTYDGTADASGATLDTAEAISLVTVYDANDGQDYTYGSQGLFAAGQALAGEPDGELEASAAGAAFDTADATRDPYAAPFGPGAQSVTLTFELNDAASSNYLLMSGVPTGAELAGNRAMFKGVIHPLSDVEAEDRTIYIAPALEGETVTVPLSPGQFPELYVNTPGTVPAGDAGAWTAELDGPGSGDPGIIVSGGIQVITTPEGYALQYELETGLAEDLGKSYTQGLKIKSQNYDGAGGGDEISFDVIFIVKDKTELELTFILNLEDKPYDGFALGKDNIPADGLEIEGAALTPAEKQAIIDGLDFLYYADPDGNTPVPSADAKNAGVYYLSARVSQLDDDYYSDYSSTLAGGEITPRDVAWRPLDREFTRGDDGDPLWAAPSWTWSADFELIQGGNDPATGFIQGEDESDLHFGSGDPEVKPDLPPGFDYSDFAPSQAGDYPVVPQNADSDEGDPDPWSNRWYYDAGNYRVVLQPGKLTIKETILDLEAYDYELTIVGDPDSTTGWYNETSDSFTVSLKIKPKAEPDYDDVQVSRTSEDFGDAITIGGAANPDDQTGPEGKLIPAFLFQFPHGYNDPNYADGQIVQFDPAQDSGAEPYRMDFTPPAVADFYSQYTINTLSAQIFLRVTDEHSGTDRDAAVLLDPYRAPVSGYEYNGAAQSFTYTVYEGGMYTLDTIRDIAGNTVAPDRREEIKIPADVKVYITHGGQVVDAPIELENGDAAIRLGARVEGAVFDEHFDQYDWSVADTTHATVSPQASHAPDGETWLTPGQKGITTLKLSVLGIETEVAVKVAQDLKYFTLELGDGAIVTNGQRDMKEGDGRTQLIARALDKNGNPVQGYDGYVWTVDDDEVLTIHQSQLGGASQPITGRESIWINPVKMGTATVTLTDRDDGDIVATFTVRVTDEDGRYVTDIYVRYQGGNGAVVEQHTMKEADPAVGLEAFTKDGEYDPDDYTWTVADSTIATIHSTASGSAENSVSGDSVWVRPAGMGITNLVVTAVDGRFVKTVELTVTDENGLILNVIDILREGTVVTGSSYPIRENEAGVEFTAATPANQAQFGVDFTDLVWTVEDDSIATIHVNRGSAAADAVSEQDTVWVRPVRMGKTTLQVTAVGRVTATVDLVVTDEQGLYLDTIYIQRDGETVSEHTMKDADPRVQFTAVTPPDQAQYGVDFSDFEWTIADDSIATLHQSGSGSAAAAVPGDKVWIQPVRMGRTTVTVTALNRKIHATLQLTVTNEQGLYLDTIEIQYNGVTITSHEMKETDSRAQFVAVTPADQAQFGTDFDDYVWTVDNSSYATIHSARIGGKADSVTGQDTVWVQPVEMGYATLSVSALNGTVVAQVRLTITDEDGNTTEPPVVVPPIDPPGPGGPDGPGGEIPPGVIDPDADPVWIFEDLTRAEKAAIIRELKTTGNTTIRDFLDVKKNDDSGMQLVRRVAAIQVDPADVIADWESTIWFQRVRLVDRNTNLDIELNGNVKLYFSYPDKPNTDYLLVHRRDGLVPLAYDSLDKTVGFQTHTLGQFAMVWHGDGSGGSGDNSGGNDGGSGTGSGGSRRGGGGGGSRSSDGQAGRLDEDYWLRVLNAINKAAPGDTVHTHPPDYITKCPSYILEALQNRDVTLMICWLDEQIIINGLTMNQILTLDGRLYYTLEELARLFGMANYNAITDSALHNPPMGGDDLDILAFNEDGVLRAVYAVQVPDWYNRGAPAGSQREAAALRMEELNAAQAAQAPRDRILIVSFMGVLLLALVGWKVLRRDEREQVMEFAGENGGRAYAPTTVLPPVVVPVSEEEWKMLEDDGEASESADVEERPESTAGESAAKPVAEKAKQPVRQTAATHPSAVPQKTKEERQAAAPAAAKKPNPTAKSAPAPKAVQPPVSAASMKKGTEPAKRPAASAAKAAPKPAPQQQAGPMPPKSSVAPAKAAPAPRIEVNSMRKPAEPPRPGSAQPQVQRPAAAMPQRPGVQQPRRQPVPAQWSPSIVKASAPVQGVPAARPQTPFQTPGNMYTRSSSGSAVLKASGDPRANAQRRADASFNYVMQEEKRLRASFKSGQITREEYERLKNRLIIYG